MGDERGSMCVIEAEKELPFPVKRVFYDFASAQSKSRGNHANQKSKFAFISLAGACSVSVDDGVFRETFRLDDPHKMLCVDKMVWKTMDLFTPDNVLLVISDQSYDPSEYIHDYEKFTEMCAEKR